mmetsp:Transcript_25859/g.62285  ORF Transcript_25859/g.62285 Transcript_25859/m.62285 type:complete len:374 (-) Transcript_25859:198-1319(-)|eukprot:CAMPEP_0114486164 /NCGR_PEP_ID=MMETSP0109-20121206/72_1 /TAXON_ID=29199 /ORGANISM="Chlorarachnion reptans, Strain CCCM449" /LENGTH=373 /DNA_ID=CAMNT_0001662315 /DNA_START=215 /DNA_END=1336 /DNA_ORIENTATION=+
MVRRVEVIVSKRRTEDILNRLKPLPYVHALTAIKGDTTDLLMFRCKEKHVRQVVYNLSEIGVGTEFGVIDVVNLQMTKPRLQFKKDIKAYSTTERQTIEEIYEIVDGSIHLTFDYLAFTFVAAIISAVGLITDSSVTVVASMLVSPLMGPILGISFGYLIGDTYMMLKSTRNELAGVLLTFVVGIFSGCFNLIDKDISVEMNNQMLSRATVSGLLAGAVVASPSGIGVALSVANTNVNSLVGVAISAALLPPIVNSALCLVYGIANDLCGSGQRHCDPDMAHYYYKASAISMGLFLMNWVLIFVFSMVTFHVKGLKRSELINLPQWRGSAFQNSTDVIKNLNEPLIDEKEIHLSSQNHVGINVANELDNKDAI